MRSQLNIPRNLVRRTESFRQVSALRASACVRNARCRNDCWERSKKLRREYQRATRVLGSACRTWRDSARSLLTSLCQQASRPWLIGFPAKDLVAQFLIVALRLGLDRFDGEDGCCQPAGNEFTANGDPGSVALLGDTRGEVRSLQIALQQMRPDFALRGELHLPHTVL